MLVLLDLILLAVVASCSDARNRVVISSADCNFDGDSLCRWMPDPRDGGARWSLETLMLSTTGNQVGSNRVVCLRPSRRSDPQVDPFALLDEEEEADGNALGSGNTGSRNLSARLWSSKIRTLDGSPVQCLRMAYQMVLGEPVEESPVLLTGPPNLAMLRHSSGSCHELFDHHLQRTVRICEPQSIWSQAANVSDSWRRANIDIGVPTVDDFKLILEGTIPAGYPDARICVDNITSYTEPCSALEPKPVKPASSLNWAHYFGMIFIAALALGLIIPILFLVIIIFVCRRRHQYRHSNFANSKLFSTNLWHYIGGKEVAEDPFAEHTTSFHRPPFMGNKFGDGTLAMRNGDMMDLPDVVIPGGRVVSMGYNGGTLGPNGTMRHQSAASFNGYPYGSATMTMGKPMMGQPGMGYMQPPMSPNMAASQHNAQTMFQPNHFYNGNADPHMQPQQQMTQQPQQMQGTVANNQPPRMQTGAVQQAGPAVVPPSNYFRSLTQAVEDHPAPATHAVQPVTAAAPQPVVAHPPVSSGDHAANSTAPFEDNGPFVLPDPPSDGGHPGAHVASVERDQADAIEALNSATEVSAPATAAAVAAPRPVTTTTTSASTAGEAVYTGEHPPPGYDEAVGMVPSRRDQQKAALPVPAASAVAPVLPPRRAGAGGPFAGNGQPESAAGLSLAERYGLPVADI